MNVRSSSPRPKKMLGFTLIETLIVIAVLGILLSIGVPNLNRYIQSSRFQQSVRVFQEGLVSARDAATRNSMPVRFEAAGSHISWFDSSEDVQLDSRELPFGTALSGSGTDAIISGRGLPQAQVRFDLSNGDFSASVYFLPTGAVLR